jgi:hypothetical protein
MGHFVTGLIAKPKLLASFAQKHSLHEPIELAQGFAILPLRDEDIDSFISLPMTGQPEGFTYLSEQLLRELMLASKDSEILYFETEYHGGTGGQGAVVLSNGEIAYGPQSAEGGPINEALRIIGVKVGSAHDEFEAIGLDQHRHTDDWLVEAK